MLLANLANKHSKPIIKAGAIPHLVKCITAGKPKGKEWAVISSQQIPAPTLRYLRLLRSSPWCTC